MHMPKFATALLILFATVLTAPQMSAQDTRFSPLRAKWKAPKFDAATRSLFERLGRETSIQLEIENSSDALCVFEGSLNPQEGLWIFGRRGQLDLEYPDGTSRRYKPTQYANDYSANYAFDARGSTTTYLNLDRYFFLNQAGKYRLSCIFYDEEGRALRCPDLEFKKLAPPNHSQPIEVSIKTDTIGPTTLYVVVKFRNRHDKALTIIHPLDGSLWGWHEPHYWFSMVDSSGLWVPNQARCGNSGGSYDEHTMVHLKPGKEVTIQVAVPKSLDPGDYQVFFSYLMFEKPERRLVAHFGDSGDSKKKALPKIADDLFLGRVSAEMRVKIPGENPLDWLKLPVSELHKKLIAATRLKPSDAKNWHRRQRSLEVFRWALGHQVFDAAALNHLQEQLRRELAVRHVNDIDAMLLQGIARLVDERFYPVLIAQVLVKGKASSSPPGFYEASKLLKKVARKRAGREIIKELKKRPDDSYLLCLALETFYGGRHNLIGYKDLGKGSYSGRAPMNAKEYAMVRERWLAWWPKSSPDR